jgi:hypothetical protein
MIRGSQALGLNWEALHSRFPAGGSVAANRIAECPATSPDGSKLTVLSVSLLSSTLLGLDDVAHRAEGESSNLVLVANGRVNGAPLA